MELLILKSGEDYIRIDDKRYSKCGLDKASVFPLDQVEKVAFHLAELRKLHLVDAAIVKLILEEKPYDKNERLQENTLCDGC
jgi:hypothetical protein